MTTERGGRAVGGAYIQGGGHLDWAERGNCHGRVDLTRFFFPDPPARGRARSAAWALDEAEAKGRCRGLTNDVSGPCPVREECLEYAMRTNEPAGVWGGLNTDERHQLGFQRNLPIAN